MSLKRRFSGQALEPVWDPGSGRFVKDLSQRPSLRSAGHPGLPSLPDIPNIPAPALDVEPDADDDPKAAAWRKMECLGDRCLTRPTQSIEHVEQPTTLKIPRDPRA